VLRYATKADILLKAHVVDEINATLDTLCQEDISRSRDSDNMGVFVERLE
jgi:hypothetical protein